MRQLTLVWNGLRKVHPQLAVSFQKIAGESEYPLPPVCCEELLFATMNRVSPNNSLMLFVKFRKSFRPSKRRPGEPRAVVTSAGWLASELW